MVIQKLVDLETEIKNLYLSQENDNERMFWSVHIKPVVELSIKLAKKYKADLEVVWLAAIMHDIGQLDSLKAHEEIGSEKAYQILIERGFAAATAEKVKAIILTHRVNRHQPKSLEQKILATADAMSHFNTPYYFWLARVNDQPLSDLFAKVKKKLDKDFREKIFFDNERKEIKKQYEVLRDWFNQ